MSNISDNSSNPSHVPDRLLSLWHHPVANGALKTAFISVAGAGVGCGISYMLSSSLIKGAIIGTGISAAFLAADDGGKILGEKMIKNSVFAHATSENLELDIKKSFAALMFSLMTTVTASAGLYWTPPTSSSPQASQVTAPVLPPASSPAASSPAASVPLLTASSPKPFK